MRDLESVIESAETNTHSQGSAKDKEHNVQLSFSKNDISQVTEVPVTLDYNGSQVGETGMKTCPVEVNPASGPLDLNAEAFCARISFCERSGKCDDNPTKVSLPGKHDREPLSSCVNSKGIDVDLNAEDVTSCMNLDSSESYKEHDQFKSKDVSETGSCTGPLKEKDPMRIWREMKRNGFLSSSHGGIPMPKQRGRKSKNDVLKKKMELAKREQINRFSKIAAPSGLLNELNPGIINHVRNKKQVHSIIEALVRSEKLENANIGCKQAAHLANGSAEVSKRDLEYMTEAGKYQLPLHHEEGIPHSSSGSKKARKHPVTMNDSWVLEGKAGESDTCLAKKDSFKSCVSQFSHGAEDDILALKLSSSTKASVSSSSLSNEESSNLTSVSSLSLKAATVASQWLELLHQDIKGRLSALRRSRRRVRAVINTELPFLMSKEFSNNQDDDSYVMKASSGLPNSRIAEMHRARWTALFDQMDEALSEEEKQLESWLNQVKEKQLLCDQGLQHVNWNTAYGLQQLGTSENDSRYTSEKELAVNAAAASIYSTCNFLLSES
ncbi:cation-transporting ATPase [Senna tora]|uniref:Cation-transporting ATPase n=1 Tax=Senna tora TaxID=362788 RepID=A0A834TYG5_9FABA|nr:cation-transporting ATPase [Senna tora]